jgi:hypothetical protein
MGRTFAATGDHPGRKARKMRAIARVRVRTKERQ